MNYSLKKNRKVLNIRLKYLVSANLFVFQKYYYLENRRKVVSLAGVYTLPFIQIEEVSVETTYLAEKMNLQRKMPGGMA
jgi:hypothetical protein